MKKAIEWILSAEDSELTPERFKRFADKVYDLFCCRNEFGEGENKRRCQNYADVHHWCPKCKESLPDPKTGGMRTVKQAQEGLARLGKQMTDKENEKNIQETLCK